MEGSLAFTTQDQCGSVGGFLGTVAAERSRGSWKVEDASADTPYLLCIYTAHRFYSLTKLLPGPQRIGQENLALSTKAIFVCAQGKVTWLLWTEVLLCLTHGRTVRWRQRLRSPVSGVFKQAS